MLCTDLLWGIKKRLIIECQQWALVKWLNIIYIYITFYLLNEKILVSVVVSKHCKKETCMANDNENVNTVLLFQQHESWIGFFRFIHITFSTNECFKQTGNPFTTACISCQGSSVNEVGICKLEQRNQSWKQRQSLCKRKRTNAALLDYINILMYITRCINVYYRTKLM